MPTEHRMSSGPIFSAGSFFSRFPSIDRLAHFYRATNGAASGLFTHGKSNL
jgi:hypothetical protein